MTTKELLYIEDCLSVEQQLQIKCADYASKVTDAQLKQVLTTLSQKHQQHFSTLMSQLGQ